MLIYDVFFDILLIVYQMKGKSMSEKGEIRRLKKENRYLKKKLYKLETKMHSDNEDASKNAECFSAGNYFSFLFSKLKQKKFFPIFQKYFKNSLWVTRIFRWGVLIYQYLQAGAFVILYTAAFILIIPVFLAIAILTLVSALILRNKSARLLFGEITDDVIFIIPKDKDTFNKAVICELCEKHNEKTVLIISPFFFSKKGIGKSPRMYVCFRKECKNVFILRNYFFFYFRRRLKTEKNCSTEEVYLD